MGALTLPRHLSRQASLQKHVDNCCGSANANSSTFKMQTLCRCILHLSYLHHLQLISNLHLCPRLLDPRKVFVGDAELTGRMEEGLQTDTWQRFLQKGSPMQHARQHSDCSPRSQNAYSLHCQPRCSLHTPTSTVNAFITAAE